MNKTNYLISVILPTYNRAGYLCYTLSLLKDQIKRHSEEVELVVCDNASTDNTEEVLYNEKEKDGYFRYVSYKNHVDIGISISRSVDNATGKYVLLWSDDDLPCPMLIDLLLLYIKKYPDVSCIHFNGMNGRDSDNYSLSNLVVKHKNLGNECQLYDSSDFIEKYYMSMGVMSADLFMLSSWKEGQSVDTSKHFGFEFLVPMLYGVKGKKCLYVGFPLWIQRDPKYRSWQSKSTLYWYIGVPNILRDMQKLGLIKSWENLWYEQVNGLRGFVHIVAQMALDKKIYIPLRKELKANQRGVFRKMYIDFVLYCVPSSFYKFLRELWFKK